MWHLPRESLLEWLRPETSTGRWHVDSTYANTLVFPLVARKYVARKEVLDAACGWGHGAYLYAKRAKSVVGVDLDAECIAHARQKYAGDNLQFMEMDVTDLDLPDRSLDVVVSIETLEHIRPEATDAYVEQFFRVLRPGGLIVISTPNRAGTEKAGISMSGHVNEKTARELREVVGRRFRLADHFCFLRAREDVSAPDGHRSRIAELEGKGLGGALERGASRAAGWWERRVRGQKIRPLLRAKKVRRMRSQRDEERSIFQILVARKDVD